MAKPNADGLYAGQIIQSGVESWIWNGTNWFKYDKSGDSSSFSFLSGDTDTRLEMIADPTWNVREFVYLDTECDRQLIYKPQCEFFEFKGQSISSTAPEYNARKSAESTADDTWANGTIWKASDTIYMWNAELQYWVIYLEKWVHVDTIGVSETGTHWGFGGGDVYFYNDGEDLHLIYKNTTADVQSPEATLNGEGVPFGEINPQGTDFVADEFDNGRLNDFHIMTIGRSQGLCLQFMVFGGSVYYTEYPSHPVHAGLMQYEKYKGTSSTDGTAFYNQFPLDDMGMTAKMIRNCFDMMYPIGSIAFGAKPLFGTWTRWNSGGYICADSGLTLTDSAYTGLKTKSMGKRLPNVAGVFSIRGNSTSYPYVTEEAGAVMGVRLASSSQYKLAQTSNKYTDANYLKYFDLDASKSKYGCTGSGTGTDVEGCSVYKNVKLTSVEGAGYDIEVQGTAIEAWVRTA